MAITPGCSGAVPTPGMVQVSTCGAPTVGLLLPPASAQGLAGSAAVTSGPVIAVAVPVRVPMKVTSASGRGGVRVSVMVVPVASDGPLLRTLSW